jgi:hypothetical protein
MQNVKNRLNRLEQQFARIMTTQRLDLLLVDVDESVENARARKYPEGVPDDVRLLTIQFV